MKTPTRSVLAVLILFLALFASTKLPAADKYTFIVEKQEEKAKHRWSLSEWLDTRDRMRMMDLWLALHSPSPYEFFLGGTYRAGNQINGPVYTAWDGHFGAYAYLFGIELQYQSASLHRRATGTVHFRLLGYHQQATNLTFHGGVRMEERGGTQLWNPVAGVSMTFYLFKSFGFDLLYRHAFGRSSGVAASSDRAEVGAFIDFKFLRVFGGYFSEMEPGAVDESMSGGQIGMRLYF